ncbi:hypothetical protein KUV85_11040 [Nocardioides panacisoli]|uniref:hypothetical protein n=1 Tax=Nocardioides panacisoli TaxID=627624 RepID=UPI001C624F78|nr:hypothetical protein [Nocardioides panacisoli]QYJ02869.1 hypothetical protein KUV85_11040 [Nocardioides panacisoli]
MDHGARGVERVWSWAASGAEAEARRRDAHELVGEYLRSVHYFTIDYRRQDVHPELIDDGPRIIEANSEWLDPPWLHEGFDAIEFGLEIATESGAVFSLTWDPPGEREGIGLQRVAMLGSGVHRDAGVGIWDVGARTPAWRLLVGRRITGVDLHYEPWDEETGSLWCPRITVRGESGRVEIVMGDAENGLLVPSADNVAVLHSGTERLADGH